MVDETSTNQTRWKLIPLGNVAKIIKNQFKPGEGNYKYIGLEHINQNDLSINGFGNSNAVESNKFYFRSGDILFGKLRPYFRKIVKPRFDGVCSTDIWVIRANKENNQDFLYYFLANQEFVDFASKANSGTKMPRADWHFLENAEWYFPPFPEQRAIAAVLSSFDDKIELLREQNKTLENIAQAIFKEWFVKFNFPDENGKPYKANGGKMMESELGEIPEGWRVGKIGDILELLYGKGLITEERTDKGFPVVGSGGIVGYHEEFLVEAPGIVVGRKGTMGSVLWIEENFFPIDTTFYVKDKININGLFYHLFILKRQDFERIGSDSAVPGLNRDSAYSVEIILPPKQMVHKFNISVSPFFNQMKNNNFQIQTLSHLRDTLLPKLMKGEIRVKEFIYDPS